MAYGIWHMVNRVSRRTKANEKNILKGMRLSKKIADRLSVSTRYYLSGLLVIIVIPIVILELYDWLAGGC